MKQMSKWIALSLALLMIAALLCGCGMRPIEKNTDYKASNGVIFRYLSLDDNVSDDEIKSEELPNAEGKWIAVRMMGTGMEFSAIDGFVDQKQLQINGVAPTKCTVPNMFDALKFSVYFDMPADFDASTAEITLSDSIKEASKEDAVVGSYLDEKGE